MATFAPAAARCWAIPRLIPELPPVMKATFPANSPSLKTFTRFLLIRAHPRGPGRVGIPRSPGPSSLGMAAPRARSRNGAEEECYGARPYAYAVAPPLRRRGVPLRLLRHSPEAAPGHHVRDGRHADPRRGLPRVRGADLHGRAPLAGRGDHEREQRSRPLPRPHRSLARPLLDRRAALPGDRRTGHAP